VLVLEGKGASRCFGRERGTMSFPSRSVFVLDCVRSEDSVDGLAGSVVVRAVSLMR
jgi:hypothetical protein